MLLQLRPKPHLQEFVRFYRTMQLSFPDFLEALPHKPYPPRPETCLSFYPRDTEPVEYLGSGKMVSNCRAALYGKQSVVTNRHVGREFWMIQVVFQPFGLYRLTGIPAHTFTNDYVDAETVFSKEIRLVNERLSGSADMGEMIGIVEDFLTHLASRSPKACHPIDTVSGLLLNNLDKFSLDYLAKESFLSPKQFERKFLERIGINPRYFARIVRFDKAFRLRNAHPHKDWLSIAIEAGYYDYQHLAKAYKEFTNFSPNHFYLQETQAPERHFGIVET